MLKIRNLNFQNPVDRKADPLYPIRVKLNLNLLTANVLLLLSNAAVGV